MTTRLLTLTLLASTLVAATACGEVLPVQELPDAAVESPDAAPEPAPEPAPAPAAPVCGDGTCDGSEDAATCCTDCGCGGGETCSQNACSCPATKHAVAYSDLAAHVAACNGTSESYGAFCNAAIENWCTARGGCATGGLGPTEINVDAEVVCMRSTSRSTTFTELAAHHAGCTNPGLYGMGCNSAINRYCSAAGFVTGYGPIGFNGDAAWVACSADAVISHTTYTTLAQFQGQCDGSSSTSISCNAAINRYCMSLGKTSGWGPLERNGNDIQVACVQ